ncbi:MAG TPA: ATP synthase F1 subunit gamma [Acidimicrobiales bacterium]|nr:ATP synthase F1 subunit gamma [Acidimicrobiales bacterium]
MAGSQERVLRRRIRSIQSTRKTTRAMELIAASRIVRAQQRIGGGRPYVERIDSLASDLVGAPGTGHHRLIEPPDPLRRVAVVVITSDRGLCGPYNTQVLRTTERVLAEHEAQGHERTLVVVGRRGQSYLRFRGYDIAHTVVGITDRPTYLDARQVADRVIGPFVDADVDQIELISTRFISAGTQRVEHRVVVPVPGQLGEDDDGGEDEARVDYDAEPSEEEILDRLLPSLIEAQLFLALLDASASEHAARQRAMKAATDNADDLVTNLRRVMNRARQDTITSEIIDIVGGAEALRGEGAGHEPEPSEPRSAAP